MARHKYQEAFGVLDLKWDLGEPYSPLRHKPYLVEVWRASTRIRSDEARKPQVRVHASLEIWFWDGEKWREMDWGGAIHDAKPGEIRRHAGVTRVRNWSATINIDGWNG